MTKQELLEKIEMIDDQLSNAKKLYEPFEGIPIDMLSKEEREVYEKIKTTVTSLVIARSILRTKANSEYGTFVI